jgi:hypothetical protein
MSNSHRIAILVTNQLRRRDVGGLKPRVVQSLIETLFHASLKTEESRAVFCTVIFVGSGSRLHEPPDSERRSHRYIFVPLEQPIFLTPGSLSKFAQAAAPWASCIAVRERHGRFEICGMFDQEIHYQNALNREGESRFSRPGLFQVELSGVGTLTVYDNRKLLAKLSQDILVTTFHDVLSEGPIANGLRRYVDQLEQRAKIRLQTHFKRRNVTEFLVDAPVLWTQTLSRILLGIRRLDHGGAVLLIPSSPTTDLSINYSILYDKTEQVLERHLLASARWQIARAKMRFEFFAPGSSIPTTLVKERRSAFNEREDAKKGELGCATFVSSLAGVDGLILLSRGLRVCGFGVEIKGGKDPAKVFGAGNPAGTLNRLRQLDLNHFGTRHRSMMRYCDRHRGSIGFVISQDGDVRAITRTEHGLIVWENIQLQEIELEDRAAEKRPTARKIVLRQQEIEEQLERSLFYDRVSRTKGHGVKQQIWLTRSGDPLKVVIDTKSVAGGDRLEIYFNEDGYVLSVTSHCERLLAGGEIAIEEETSYFELWTLVKMTRKIAHFTPGSQTEMAGVKSTPVDVLDLDENDRRPNSFQEQSREAIRAVLAKRKTANRPASGDVGDRNRFSFIQGTSSPDGRFALGFSLEQPVVELKAVGGTLDFMRRHYYVGLEEWEGAKTNYVVEVETNRIIGETKCNYIGTRSSFNHRACETVWSQNNRFMVQHFHGKWHTIKATIVRIDYGGGSLTAINLVEPIRKQAFEFLRRTKDRAFRRFGFERFAISVSCEKISPTGFLCFQVLGHIPKLEDEDGTFSIIQRFRILERPGGVLLKFIESRLGPRLNY